jgi:hypothetical protein
MASREELLTWIARTRRMQRSLAIVVSALLTLSAGLWLWRKPVGLFGLSVTGLVAIIGFWVTASHLDEWRIALARGGRPLR